MILGIDTASVAGNKTIDWTAAKAAGLSFAFLRSNWGDQQDTMFAREWDRIREAGLVRGAYLFLRYPRGGKSAPLPEAQAHAMISTLGKIQPGDLPPALDLEFPGAGRSETGMTVAQCLDWVLRARGVLKAEYGVDPILYTSARVWREDLGNSSSDDLAGCPLWLARYAFAKGGAVRAGAAFDGMDAPAVPPPWGDADNWWIHQYQGDATGLPGFPTGNVDMGRFNPLFEGAKGARVGWTQKRLDMTRTGVFDGVTVGVMKAFQAEHGLVADGIVGPRTFAYLAWQTV
jgi:lysozyme